MTALSADRPGTDPKDDLFGHAPFAKALADSICHYQGSDGLVLALYGPWGSGKSTVLNYVRHYLDQVPKEEQPAVVLFNPWWFSGQENLARAFLGQLQAVLPTKSDKFKKLGGLLGDFAEAIGGLIDLTGETWGLGAKLGKLIGIATKRKPKDVPTLKEEICKVLKEAGKRILVVIDDIDRLVPGEMRQLFTVIKALADFPNVVYLLAFDRDVAVQAIEQQSGLPGEGYLQKIIQVPFELPPVDRFALRQFLFKRLDEVLRDTPAGLFDEAYWANVYYGGIEPMIRVPRDVVRLTNTLSVTYPAVRGEVNPVDFIALEAIRVFLPDLYEVIRTNPDRFSGHSPPHRYISVPEEEQSFHDQWEENKVPQPLRASTRNLMERIFPKIGQMVYGSQCLAEWRRNLRACHPDVFPIYFRLMVPLGAVSRQELAAILSLAGTPGDFGKAFVQAKSERRPDGLSKAGALLERLMDHVEKDIPEEHVQTVVQALLDVGDALIDPDDKRGTVDLGNAHRAALLVYHLSKRLSSDCRADVLGSAIEAGGALATQSWLLQLFDSNANALLSAETVTKLKRTWLNKVQALSGGQGFLDHPELLRLLAAWTRWGDGIEVRTWCGRVTGSDEGLLALLSKFLWYEEIRAIDDLAVHRQPRLNPDRLVDYIDTDAAANRLRRLQQAGCVPDAFQQVVSQYLKEYDMLKSGKNLDDFYRFPE